MTYSVWQSFITNGVKTISGAVVSVFHEGSGAPAALFSSPSGGSIGSSVTSDSSGLARFYVAAGVYRITVTHASFSAEHRHVRIGEMAGVDDAPSDGKQYARKDGDWEEVTGGVAYEGLVTVTLGTGGDYANINDLSDAMASRRGKQLTIQLVDDVTMIRRQSELDGWGLVIFDLNGYNGGFGQEVRDSSISGLGTFGNNMAFINVNFWTNKKTMGANTIIRGGSINCELELGSNSVINETLLSPTPYGSAKITAATNAVTLQNCSSLNPVTLQSTSTTLSKFTLRGGILNIVTLINAIAVIGYGSSAITATSASSTNAWPLNEAPVMVSGGNFNGNVITVTGANAPQYNVYMTQGMANVFGYSGLSPTVSNSNWASATPTTNGIYFGA